MCVVLENNNAINKSALPQSVCSGVSFVSGDVSNKITEVIHVNTAISLNVKHMDHFAVNISFLDTKN